MTNNTNRFGNGTGLPVPKELTDTTTDPKLRAQVLELYTARITDFDQNLWNEAERRAVQEQVQSVLRTLGR